MSGMLSDSKILQTLREKEPLGMDALFERYYRPLVVFAESYLHDLQSAEDLVLRFLSTSYGLPFMIPLYPPALYEVNSAGFKKRGIGYFFVYRSEKCLYQLAREEEIACKKPGSSSLSDRFGRGRTFGRFRGGTDPGSLGKIT